jgi:hypothetical protein
MKNVNKNKRLEFHSLKEVKDKYFPKDKSETDLEQNNNSGGTGLALGVIIELKKNLK